MSICVLSLYGYVKRHSAQERELLSALGGAKKKQAAYFILDLRFRKDDRSENQVEIAAIRHRKWVVPFSR